MKLYLDGRANAYSRTLVGLFTFICPTVMAARGGRPLIQAATFRPTGAAAKLAGVRFVGSKRYSEAEIIRATGLKIGEEAAPDAFQETANKLAATGVFSSVQFNYHSASAGTTIEYQVTDAPKFIPCEFDNFVWFSAEELQKELRARVPLFSGDVPPAGNLGDQISAALETLLKERGVQGTVIQIPIGELGKPVEAILFRVEGVPAPIARVGFSGAGHVDSGSLQAAVKPLLGTDYSQSFVSNFARLNLGPIYHQRGYLRVSFDAPTTELDKNGGPKESVAVKIPIHEGLQYSLKEIQWSGNSVISASELSKNIHLKVGEPVNGVQLLEDLRGIQSLYWAQGYIIATDRPDPSFQDDSHTVSYRIDIVEGDLYRMGKFDVLGVDASLAKTLQGIFRPRTGEPFDAGFAKPFMAQVRHDLANIIWGGVPTFKVTPNQEKKTVDIILTFVRSSSP